MRQKINWLLFLLSLVTGAVFLYSAYTKTLSLLSFEYTIADHLHVSWQFAAIAARGLAGLETGLGALIILHLYGKRKWVLWLASVLLVVFSFYLAYLWTTVGNNVNCGCFGDTIWMSPAASLVKNALLLAAVAVLLRFHRGLAKKWLFVVTPIIFLAITALPFFIFSLAGQKPYSLNLEAMYPTSNADDRLTELRKGKHIIAFLSQSCPHCRKAAAKMHAMKQKNPDFPFFLIIAGSSDLSGFWKETQANDIPFTRMGAKEFLKATDGSFPKIVWVNNDTVVANTSYVAMDRESIEQWLRGTPVNKN